MKLKDGYVLKNMGGRNVGIYMGTGNDALNGMIQMNATGAFIWQCLEKETTKEQILAKMLEKYNVDPAAAQRDIDKIVAMLEKENILE